MASLQGWELCDQPFRRGHIAAEDLVFAVDRGTDQSSRGTWPDVELLGYDGERIAHYLGDVVSTVPQFKVEVACLLDIALTVDQGGGVTGTPGLCACRREGVLIQSPPNGELGRATWLRQYSTRFVESEERSFYSGLFLRSPHFC